MPVFAKPRSVYGEGAVGSTEFHVRPMRSSSVVKPVPFSMEIAPGTADTCASVKTAAGNVGSLPPGVGSSYIE
ncbi:MAG: hypothetical protein GC161_15025 [Planctomycetaceae bacterium]|nr:hypothetical protein [Planctomycetaceae bacterium]